MTKKVGIHRDVVNASKHPHIIEANQNPLIAYDGDHEKLGKWVANLSDGKTVIETALMKGEPTSWRWLMDYCSRNNVYITNLRLGLPGGKVYQCKNNAVGYFQAKGQFASVRSMHDRVAYNGIGWVEKHNIVTPGTGEVVEEENLFIIWANKDEAWREERKAAGHNNIIWAQPRFHGKEKDFVIEDMTKKFPK